MSTMTVGSLFAGVGGFDLAAERAGMTVAWQSENDKNASAVLAEHWPDIPNYGDIHDLTIRKAGILAGAPRVDVLAGGFPCQDYSVAGTRGGLAGDRGALWWEFRRLIAEGRPRWIVGENVPGLLSSRSGRDFGTIIDSITELGYSVAWRLLDAQYYGVAQRRRRLFIVGHSGDRTASEILALNEGLSGHPRPSRPERKGAAAAVAGRPDLSSRTAGTLGALTGGARTTDLDGNGAYIVFAQNQRNEIRELEVPGALAADPGMKQQAFIAYNVYPTGGQGADLEATQTDKAMTLSAWNGQGHDRGTRIIQQGVRRLTPLECERLQGFPDNWTASQSDTQRYSQMGNAVAVPVAEWIMRRIAEQT